MSSHSAYRRVDGLYGTSDKRLLTATVWADAATYTAGQVLIINTSGNPGPTGYNYTWKKSDANDTGLAGVVAAESVVLPSGGGTIKVYHGGTISGASHGLTSAAAIAVGERVSSSSTSGTIKKVTTTDAEGNQSYGTCVTAFSGATSDGAVEWEPCPYI